MRIGIAQVEPTYIRTISSIVSESINQNHSRIQKTNRGRMGHEHSKLSESRGEGNKGSRRARLKNRLHLHRHRKTPSSSSSSSNKLLSVDTFTGIALFALLRAEMQFKDKWIACLSLGEQTFRTKSSDQTDKPVWNSVSSLFLSFFLYF